MPSISENFTSWNNTYEWPNQGDEWSRAWGGSERLWWLTLFPRIREFIPTGTILEIGPGYGRCTQFLKDYCDRMILVDLSPRCIEASRERFASANHLEYHTNDGLSLDMVPDKSIDFVFSFDSLVHADVRVLEAYVKQLGSKLKPGGFGFIHHSNLGNYSAITKATRIVNRVLPLRWRKKLVRLGYLMNTSWRAEDMTARRFVEMCRGAGLACEHQELINWGNRNFVIDAFSTFRASSESLSHPTVFRHRQFMDEVTKLYKSRPLKF